MDRALDRRDLAQPVARGLKLASTMAARLRDVAAPDQWGKRLPEGPHFVYDDGPELFHGRTGRGPLRVVWDTNLLVDYLEFGRALWDGEPLPDRVASYGEELEGLQLIIGLWVIRDIEFHILPRVLEDARKELTARRHGERLRALEEFAAALTHATDWPCDREAERTATRQGSLQSRQAALSAALRELPDGQDRELVRESVLAEAHVFLTRDRGVLRCASALAPQGLLIASPLDLVEELCAVGAFHCLIAPRYAYWPTPDLHRISHLIDALPDAADSPR